MSRYQVVAFYKFVPLHDLKTIQTILKNVCKDNSVLGTLILSTEGINGTLVGDFSSIKTVIHFLQTDTVFNEALFDLECKYSYSDFMPFQKIKILIKKEIVTFKVPDINPHQKTGVHVDAEDWNALISDPDVLLIDTRNLYEVALGTFKGALNPETASFREFPEYVKKHLDVNKHKKIAMCCTGGIRCEKASSYLLEQGFEEVYQLKGGILKYLEKIPSSESLWHGECFIFDDRVIIEKDSIKTNL